MLPSVLATLYCFFCLPDPSDHKVFSWVCASWHPSPPGSRTTCLYNPHVQPNTIYWIFNWICSSLEGPTDQGDSSTAHPSKIIITKTAWKSSLTLFISIPLADGDSSVIRNMHRQDLCNPVPFKDTESETWAVALFEVLTDSGFYCTECISKKFSDFSWCVISFFFGQGESLFLDSSTLCFLFFFRIATHKLSFLLRFWNLLQIPLSRLQVEWVVNGIVYLRRLEIKWWIKSSDMTEGWLPVMDIK